MGVSNSVRDFEKIIWSQYCFPLRSLYCFIVSSTWTNEYSLEEQYLSLGCGGTTTSFPTSTTGKIIASPTAIDAVGMISPSHFLLNSFFTAFSLGGKSSGYWNFSEKFMSGCLIPILPNYSRKSRSITKKWTRKTDLGISNRRRKF